MSDRSRVSNLQVSQPEVTVIIPTWRRRKLLRKLLFSIARSSCINRLEVVVADSHSTDGTERLIQLFSRRVLPIQHIHTSNALAAKRNAGAQVARGSFLIFFDDDLRVANSGDIEAIVEEARRESAPVCFRVAYPAAWVSQSNYYRFKQLAHDETNDGPREIKWYRFVAMAFCIRRDLYFRLGGFSEKFLTYGGEDHAFEFSLRELGVRPLLSSSAMVWHYESSADLGVYLHKKIALMVSDTFPILFADHPEYQTSVNRLLESRAVRACLQVVPVKLLQRTVDGIGFTMGAIPNNAPNFVLRLVGKFGYFAAYCLGIRRRTSPMQGVRPLA